MASPNSSISTKDALSLFNYLTELEQTAANFSVTIDTPLDEAKQLMGSDPKKMFEDADVIGKNNLKAQLEKLTVCALGILGPPQIEHHAHELESRLQHFDHDFFAEQKSEVVKIKERALEVFAHHAAYSCEKVWKVYHRSIPYLMCMTNLAGKHIAFFNIVAAAELKAGKYNLNQKKVETFLICAKAFLHLNHPNIVIPDSEIERIEKACYDEIETELF